MFSWFDETGAETAGRRRPTATGLATVVCATLLAGAMMPQMPPPTASAATFEATSNETIATVSDGTEQETPPTGNQAGPITEPEAMARAEEALDDDTPTPEEAVPNHLIVETMPGASDDDVLAAALEGTGMATERTLISPMEGYGGVYLVSVPAGDDIVRARAHILENTQVYDVCYDVVMQTDTYDAEGGTGDGSLPSEPDTAGTEPLLMAEATTPNPYANDPMLSSKWEDDASYLNFQGAWDRAYQAGWRDSSSVTVAIIDSGINLNHIDLKDNIVASYNATGRGTMADTQSDYHGTAVAGIVSARTNNGTGTASLAYNAKILPIQVFFKDTSSGVTGASLSAIYAAIDHIIKNADNYNIKVVNMSVGATSASAAREGQAAATVIDAINRLWDSGIVLVNSMGNAVGATSTQAAASVPYSHWPTDETDKLVGVIALQKSGTSSVKRLAESNYNTSATNITAKVSAPGASIVTTSGATTGAYTAAFSGTSAAAPQVSSLLALMYSLYPEMTPAQATQILYGNVKPTDEHPANSTSYQQTGYGMINPLGAVTDAIAAKAATNPTSSDLYGLAATVGGAAYPQLSPYLNSYSIDYGTLAVAPSTADTKVEFSNVPILYDTNQVTKTSSSSVTGATGKITTTTTRTVTTTFTSTRTNSYTKSPVTRQITFTFTWKTTKDDPDATKLSELTSMRASAGGTQLSGFTYLTQSYTKDYGRISATQQLPKSVSITVPSGWTARADASNPITDTDTKSVASDGTTSGTRKVVLRYTVTSNANGSSGSPISRTYTFTFTGSYVDENTRYTNVLSSAKLLVNGQTQTLSPSQTSYSVSTGSMPVKSVASPRLTDLPTGWSQSVTASPQSSSVIDRGNGTVVIRHVKAYAIVASKGSGKVSYSVTLYNDEVPEVSSPSDVRFRDVTSATPHDDDITWLACTGVSTGWKSGTGKVFRPADAVIRADMAAFLFRLARRWGVVSDSWQPSASTKRAFSDVNASTPHAREIWWLAESGVSTGWSVGGRKEFRPYATVARQDMAAFLFRIAKADGRGSATSSWSATASARSRFSDVSSSTPHASEVWWLAESGVSTGWVSGSKRVFRGYDQVVRQDMAAFLHRMDDLE